MQIRIEKNILKSKKLINRKRKKNKINQQENLKKINLKLKLKNRINKFKIQMRKLSNLNLIRKVFRIKKMKNL